MICLTVNIIVVYFKKTEHNLFTTNIKGSVLWSKSSETLSKILEKCIRKSFFSKVSGSKNEFLHTYLPRILLKVWVTLFMTFGRTVSVNQNCY